jgi:hypothetical protein
MSDEQDRIQRALNEAKRRQLRERYGAEFHLGEGEIPPDIEHRWLSDIEEFERQFEAADRVTVRQFLGNPVLRPLGQLPSCELEQELEVIRGMLRANNIEVTFDREISSAEAYRFLTEEVMLQEIANVRIPGLTLNFLYDEFHPNTLREAIWTAEDFFQALFTRNERILTELLAPTQSTDCPSPASLQAQILAFLRDTSVFLEWDARITSCRADGNEATVRANLFWRGLRLRALGVSAAGEAHLLLTRNDGLWRVARVNLPGISAAS